MKDPIYLQDSYLKEYVTKVKQIDSNKIIVEDSLFYPTSGGQPNDLGKVIFNDNIYNVNDVRKISGEIQISLDSDSLSFSVGDEIVMELDFERRYKLMRMHSCAHLLSYVVFKNTNALISGNSLSLEKSRIDFDLENFD
jgi:misacylated tRNA(Ala) deacylase